MSLVRVRNGSLAGSVYEVGEAPLVVGRDDRAEIQILDQGVSRRHAEVFRVGEMHFIRDLDSRNGTYVNEDRISEELLRDGDEVRIGSTMLAFEDTGIESSGAGGSRNVRLAPGGDETTTIRLDDPLSGDLEDLAEPSQPVRSQDLQVLYRCSQLIADARDTTQLASEVISYIGEALQADYGCVFVRKQGAHELEIEATYQSQAQATRGIPVVSATAVRKVVQTSRPILVKGPPTGKSPDPTASLMGVGRPHGVVAAPLIAMEQVHGVLYFASHEDEHRFDKEQLELVTAVALQTGIALQTILLSQRQERILFSTVRTLSSLLEMRDAVYVGHSARVASYCASIARALGLPSNESRRIQLAALLHNVARIVIPHDQSQEGSPLELVRKENEISNKIIRRIEGLQFVLPVIYHYRERMDGTGAPDGLRDDEIPLAARILAVADRLDALTTRGEGPEWKPIALKDAILRVRESVPNHFDTRVVDALIIAHRAGKVVDPRTKTA